MNSDFIYMLISTYVSCAKSKRKYVLYGTFVFDINLKIIYIKLTCDYLKRLCTFVLQCLLSEHYDKHPVFILKDVKFKELKAMMDYMYRGEVNISQDQLALRAFRKVKLLAVVRRSPGHRKPSHNPQHHR